VTRHQGLERLGVVTRDEALEQLRIGEGRDGPILQEAADLPQYGAERLDGYSS
jgi:hypothetical protein